MAPLPYTDTGAKIAFYVLVGAFAVLEWRVRLRSGFNREGSRADRGTFYLVYLSFAAGVGGGFVLAGFHGTAIPDARWLIFIAGLVVMTAGIAIRQWSVAALGRYFTTDVRVHREQTVIDNGPYRWVRHPSYTGLLLTLAGLGLALGNWGALVALVVPTTAALVVRIRVEERALLEGLGEPYRHFMEGRARLLPRVW